ncbi:DEAD/DEAH box helicase [Chryseobacterium sp. S-02]|uniref:DEAD/DEAH box helicase n=1 Tax=Chryseobacterium sp. S-02 TaxID=3404064 RepID=UPI003CEB9589
MMELFQESAEIDLTVKLRQNKNVISYYLGKKRGLLSKESEFGYLFTVSDDEKYLFTLKPSYVPNGYNGIFYVDQNKFRNDLVSFLQTTNKICLNFNLPNAEFIKNSWNNNFFYKEEVLDENKVNLEFGLRPPQIGALHSILAHWSVSQEPAIVVMPTGTGKTETMLSLLVANKTDKILVIVPSDSLRRQITGKFLTLGVLKDSKFQIVGEDALCPIVGTLQTSFKSQTEAAEFWDKCNVIIATTSIINKCNQNDYKIFETLISKSKLLIVDEAHHCEASTWDNIATKFISQNKPVLKFTATPFRNDKKRLKGKTIYNYPLSLAQRDGSFLNINFIPIIEFNDSKADVIIAERAIEQLRNDLSQELNHKLMARVENINRAKEVFEIYKKYKEFKPMLVHSRLSDSEKRDILDKIKNDDSYRIIVCVDMLGEGYDLPTLKVCALHEIHKNITTSIQFFGRFTRSSTQKVGNATIIANIGDNNLKDNLLRKLYAKDADWNKILKVSNEGILAELNKEEDFFQKFDEEGIPYQIPLRNITPALSTVVYKVNDLEPKWNPDLYKKFFEKKNNQSVHATHQEKDLLIIIGRNNSSVRWGIIDDLINNVYDLYIIYFNREQNLLFINSSNNGSLYESLANLVIGENINLINESDIYKSLHEVEQLELFNLGVKPISEEAISYTQLFGRNVGEALDEITKKTKSSANLFGKGFTVGERITIGCSSKGRVWSRMIKTIPEFCEWCDTIGKKLNDDTIDVKNIFNFIAKPERISVLPNGITPISIIWNDEIYFRETEFFINEKSFFDYRIALNFDKTKNNSINFSIKTENIETEYELVLDSNKNSKGYSYSKIKGNDLFFTYGRNENISIDDFFKKYPPIIRFSDSSKMYNDIFFEFKYEFQAYNPELIETRIWTGVNITNESQYDKTKKTKITDSVQYFMVNELKKDEDYKIIFDDDDKDEISDIVGIKYFEEDYSKVVVDLYHCKFSQKSKAGGRIKDLYEVCGQAQRSFHWKHRIENLINHLNFREKQRFEANKPSRFEKGGTEELYIFKRIIQSGFSKVIVNIHIVQPGISKAKISNEQLKLLGATEMLLKNTGNNFNVIVSD